MRTWRSWGLHCRPLHPQRADHAEVAAPCSRPIRRIGLAFRDGFANADGMPNTDLPMNMVHVPIEEVGKGRTPPSSAPSSQWHLPHRADPERDLDLGSAGIVKVLEDGLGHSYPDMAWEPKAAFAAVAECYARGS